MNDEIYIDPVKLTMQERIEQLRDKGAFYSLAQILGMPVEEISEDKLKVFKEIMEMTELYKLMADQSVLNLSRKQRKQQEKEVIDDWNSTIAFSNIIMVLKMLYLGLSIVKPKVVPQGKQIQNSS